MAVSASTGSAAEAASARSIIALVADDDPTSRLLVGIALEGYLSTVEAENGLAAVHALEAQNFDIAIVDLDMPIMDGFGVIERARARPESRHLPIIVVTGRDDIVAIERAFALGATSFLSKPINWNIFRHQVSYVLKVARVERETRGARDAAERLASFRERGIAALEREVLQIVELVGSSGDANARADLENAADRLREVLGRVRKISQILTGASGFEPEHGGATALAEEAVQKVRAELGAAAASRIDINAPEPLSVYCDRGLAAEALKEVLVNGLTFSAAPLHVRLSIVGAPGDRIRFEVEDRGIGIPEYLLENGLEAFRPEPGGANASRGLGFGLPVVETIVQRHGGYLGVMSEPGSGSEFFLSFPSGNDPHERGVGTEGPAVAERRKASVS